MAFLTCLSTVFLLFFSVGPHTAQPVVYVYIFRGKSWRVLIEFCLLVVLSLLCRLSKLCPALQLPHPPFLGDVWVVVMGLFLLCKTIVFFPVFFMCSTAKSGQKIPNSGLEFKNKFEKCRREFILLCCMCHSHS